MSSQSGSSPSGAPEDPFEGLVLDEQFVAGARRHEPSAAERARRSASPAPWWAPPTPQRPARRRGRWVLGTIALVGVVGAIVLASELAPDPARDLAGGDLARGDLAGGDLARGDLARGDLARGDLAGGDLAGGPARDPAEAPWPSPGAPVPPSIVGPDRPTPTRAPSGRPLGSPPPVPADAGPHRFLHSQGRARTPLAYDPCRPVNMVVNPRTAPPGGAALLDQALDRIAQATGLHIRVEGLTDERPVLGRMSFQPQRYGDRWAPVLIAWSDPVELPALDGPIGGIAGSAAYRRHAWHPAVYVSGLVALDGPQLAEMLDGPDGERIVRTVMLHELGHLLGLDHVDDPTQVMFASGTAADYQPGDLAGLAQLGSGRCVRRL
jgi:hypothetical protein